MINKDYTLAGWLSIISAALTLPMVFMSVFFLYAKGEYKVTQTILLTINTGIVIYIFFSFKELLNNKFNFKEVNTFVDILIVGNAFLLLLIIFSFFIEIFIVDLLVIIAIITLGIVQVVIFIKLLDLKEDLYGHLKPLAYSSIIAGILTASIILTVVSFIPSIISDIMLGMIFFKASKK